MKVWCVLALLTHVASAEPPFIGPPEKPRVIITETHCEMLDPLEFAPGSAALGPGQKKTIATVARTMLENQDLALIDVMGHADQVERAPELIALARAMVVMNALIAAGVPPARLTAESVANTQPLDVRPWPRAQARNRRVVFLILKRGS